MPWKECSVMDERLRFVARILEGEPITDVCSAFGISRKTGYKLMPSKGRQLSSPPCTSRHQSCDDDCQSPKGSGDGRRVVEHMPLH